MKDAAGNLVSFVFRAQSHERTAPAPAKVLEDAAKAAEDDEAAAAAAKDEEDDE